MHFLNLFTSFIFILFTGFYLGFILEKVKIDKTIGYLLSGFILGPNVLNLVDYTYVFIYQYLIFLLFLILISKLGLSIKIKRILKLDKNILIYSIFPSFFITGLGFIFIYNLLNLNLIISLLISFSISSFSYSYLLNYFNKDVNKIDNKKNENIINILTYSIINTLLILLIFYGLYNIYKDVNTNNLFKYFKPLLSFLISIISGFGIGFLLSKSFSILAVKKYIKLIIFIIITMFLLYIELIFTFIPFSAIISVLSISLFIKEKNENDSIILKNYCKKMDNFILILVFSFIGIKTNFKDTSIKNYYLLFIILSLIIISMLIMYLLELKNKNIIKKERLIKAISILPKSLEMALMVNFLILLKLPELKFISNSIFIIIIVTSLIFNLLNNFILKKLVTK